MSSKVKKRKKQRLSNQHGRKCANPDCNQRTNLTIDHVRPLSRGGTNRLSNMQLLCPKCNREKGARNIDYRRIRREREYRMPDYDLIQPRDAA